jgi:hypothetical protein
MNYALRYFPRINTWVVWELSFYLRITEFIHNLVLHCLSALELAIEFTLGFQDNWPWVVSKFLYNTPSFLLNFSSPLLLKRPRLSPPTYPAHHRLAPWFSAVSSPLFQAAGEVSSPTHNFHIDSPPRVLSTPWLLPSEILMTLGRVCLAYGEQLSTSSHPPSHVCLLLHLSSLTLSLSHLFPPFVILTLASLDL